MNRNKVIGMLFVVGAIGVFVPYSILTIIFDYPDILRQDPAVILGRFYDAGPNLIYTWLAFALLGMPLVVGYAILGKKMETERPFVNWITTFGIISGMVQIIGLLRWVFVVPVLARDYAKASDPAMQASIINSFKLIHQFGGVLLGEHLGQFFTIVWTVGMSYAMFKAMMIPKWLATFGFVASAIYLLAQAELLATVIPDFPVWEPAGFIGSTLWLLWLIIVGNKLIRITSKS